MTPAVWISAPGSATRAHRQKIAQREMHADAEHQQDHTDLGQFVRDRLIADETRGGRAAGDAGDKIADQRRQAKLGGDETEDEGQPEADRQQRDQRGVMDHSIVMAGVDPTTSTRQHEAPGSSPGMTVSGRKVCPGGEARARSVRRA